MAKFFCIEFQNIFHVCKQIFFALSRVAIIKKMAVFVSSFYIEFQNIFAFANKYFFALSSVAIIKKTASGFLCHCYLSVPLDMKKKYIH